MSEEKEGEITCPECGEINKVKVPARAGELNNSSSLLGDPYSLILRFG